MKEIVKNLPIPEIQYLLNKSFSKKTALNPNGWTKKNPSFSHCVVAALIVQDILGGRIQKGFIPEKYATLFGKSHYWNVLDDGRIIDLTKEQFPIDFPWKDLILGLIGKAEEKDYRNYVLSYSQTVERYELLKKTFLNKLYSNSLFLDEKFQKCWTEAFNELTVCPKMRFTCLVYDNDKLIVQETNRSMTKCFSKERFCSIDGFKCVRLNIKSRMDPSIGDCGYAPIWALAKVFQLGYKPSDLPKLNFYEAGFFIDRSPYWRKEPTYTCLSCENSFIIFGLDKIYIPFKGKWVPSLTQNAFYEAVKYALGKN